METPEEIKVFMKNNQPHKGSKTWEFLAALSATLLAVCVGTLSGWNSPSLPKLMRKDSPIPLNSGEASWLASSITVGAIVGPPLGANIVDRIGRKKTLLLASVPLVISWSLVIIAGNFRMLLIARFCGGFVISSSMLTCPIYLGEIVSTGVRGGLIMLYTVMFNIGLFFAYAVGPYVEIRTMAWICLGVSLAFVLCFSQMPESPYFLVTKGRLDEAKESLVRLRNRYDVSEELRAIEKTVTDSELKRRATLSEVLQKRSCRRGLVIVGLFVLCQQFGGFYSFLNYSQIIFTNIGNIVPPDVAAALMALVQLISSLLASLVVDRFGRKPLILTSGLIATTCLAFLSIFFYLRERARIDLEQYSLAATLIVMIFVAAMACGILPLQIVMLSELFSPKSKATVIGFLLTYNAIMSTVAAKLYLVVATSCGHFIPFICFFFVMLTGTPLLHLIVPETKGKSFTQIQRDLGN